MWEVALIIAKGSIPNTKNTIMVSYCNKIHYKKSTMAFSIIFNSSKKRNHFYNFCIKLHVTRVLTFLDDEDEHNYVESHIVRR